MSLEGIQDVSNVWHVDFTTLEHHLSQNWQDRNVYFKSTSCICSHLLPCSLHLSFALEKKTDDIDAQVLHLYNTGLLRAFQDASAQNLTSFIYPLRHRDSLLDYISDISVIVADNFCRRFFRFYGSPGTRGNYSPLLHLWSANNYEQHRLTMAVFH